MKKKLLTKKEKAELWAKVDNEGFGYYMLQYGPDLDAIERMGYVREDVEKAIELFSAIETSIMAGEEYADELD